MSDLNIKNPTDWANAFLGALGLPDTKTNVRNIVGWENSEGGNWHNTAKFNPLDTAWQEPGSSVMGGGNKSGVQAYTSWQQGLDATLSTIDQTGYGYEGILAALNASVPWKQFAQSVSASSWGGKGNTYLESFANPPGISGGSNPSQYSSGVDNTSRTNTIDNKPSTTQGAFKESGLAGILQVLDSLYNQNTNVKYGWSLGIIPDLPSDVTHMAQLIFIRATSAILSIGLISIGVMTLMRGSSGGSSGSGNNVIEFVNNQQRNNLSKDRISAALDKERNVITRHNEWLNNNEQNRKSRENVASTPRLGYRYSASHIFHHTEPKSKQKVKVKWIPNPAEHEGAY